MKTKNIFSTTNTYLPALAGTIYPNGSVRVSTAFFGGDSDRRMGAEMLRWLRSNGSDRRESLLAVAAALKAGAAEGRATGRDWLA